MLGTFRRNFDELRGCPPDDILKSFVNATFEAYRINTALHRILLQEWSGNNDLEQSRKVSLTIVDLLENALAHSSAPPEQSRIRLVSFMIETAIEAMMHRAILYSPELFDRKMRDELVLMATAYLHSSPVTKPDARLGSAQEFARHAIAPSDTRSRTGVQNLKEHSCLTHSNPIS